MDPSRDAAGKAALRVRGLASQEPHDVPAPLPDLDDLARDLHPYLLDYPEDVPLRRVRVGTDDKVGSAEEEKVDKMVFHVEGVVLELPDQLCGERRFHPVNLVEGLRRRHVVRRRADAADIRHDPRHLFDGPAQAKPLEAPQLGHLEIGVLHVPLVVEKDLDLPVTLQSRYRIYRYSFAHLHTSFFDASLCFFRREDAVVKR